MRTSELEMPRGAIRLIGQPSPEMIASLVVEEGLGSAYHCQPEELRKTLDRAVSLAHAEVVAAEVPPGRLVGYLIVLRPDPHERWGRDPALPLDEVVGFEVAGPWRGMGLARRMLEFALAQGDREGRIILAPLYTRYWDLEGSGLDKRSYARMLLRLFQRFGFAEFPTDEPSIRADPSNRLLVRVGPRVAPQAYLRFSGLLSGPEASSLRQMNLLPKAERELIYRRLIPDGLLDTFGIDRHTLTDRSGRRPVTFLCPADQELVRIEVRLDPEDRDCLYLLKLDQTFDGELELGFIIINDPREERFHIDRDPEGRETRLGTAGRNLPEEGRALGAGLAPGQVRRGVRLFGEALRLLERFTASLGRDRFLLEAKFYHVAILCERYGLGYLAGGEEMAWVHQGFAPGGPLSRRLDGSTPFRQAGMDRTARGRSWAIHDGILEEPWKPPRMSKRVGQAAGVATAPGLAY